MDFVSLTTGTAPRQLGNGCHMQLLMKGDLYLIMVTSYISNALSDLWCSDISNKVFSEHSDKLNRHIYSWSDIVAPLAIASFLLFLASFSLSLLHGLGTCFGYSWIVHVLRRCAWQSVVWIYESKSVLCKTHIVVTCTSVLWFHWLNYALWRRIWHQSAIRGLGSIMCYAIYYHIRRVPSYLRIQDCCTHVIHR